MAADARGIRYSRQTLRNREISVSISNTPANSVFSMSSDSESQPTDQSLLRRYRSGEQEAATRIYLRYAQRLYGLAMAKTNPDLQTRFDPEDIVQSVFRTFFRRARDGHYQVPDGDELWKLFLVIGLNKIRDAAAFHRADKRSIDRTTELPAGAQQVSSSGESVAETTLRLVIDELLEQLPENQREIIRLRLDGAQVTEIADRTQRSLRTVERTLQKFRELLHQQIGDLS